jgi:hypothetical protein
VSQQGIQRALNREQIKTTRGKVWHQGTVSKVLADPWYTGLVPGPDGELVPGRHPAIIDRDTFDRAARIRDEGRRSYERGGRPPARPYLFMNGHLRCGKCGGAMVPRTSERKSPTGKTWGKRLLGLSVPYAASKT